MSKAKEGCSSSIAADAAGVATHLMLTYRFTEQVKAFVEETSHESGAPRPRLHTLDLAEKVAGPIRELSAREAGGVLSVSTVHDTGVIGHIAISGTGPDGKVVATS